MSIAEKLQIVAENQQKVYNAGYLKGKAEGNTDLLQYATFKNGAVFRDVIFPDDVAENIYFKIQGASSTNVFEISFSYTFMASNVKNITIEIIDSMEKGVTFNSVFHICADLISVTFTNDVFYIANGANTFYDARKLENINGVIDLSLANNVGGMFGKCSSLKEVRFSEGSIYKTISFGDSSELSNDAIDSIINGLADLTGQTAQTLTLHTDIKTKLTDIQISTITGKNWTLA